MQTQGYAARWGNSGGCKGLIHSFDGKQEYGVVYDIAEYTSGVPEGAANNNANGTYARAI